MITDIGIVAGEIWHYLDENGESALSVISNKIERNYEIVLMSVGWLAREGHVVLEQKNSDYKVKLRKSD